MILSTFANFDCTVSAVGMVSGFCFLDVIALSLFCFRFDYPISSIYTLYLTLPTGVTVKASLSTDLPPLRLLLVMDNLTGHKTPDWLIWCFHHGILPIFTLLGGGWLNMAESIRRILKRRVLDGFHPQDVQTIIDRLETVAWGWNAHPTPFVWNGKRRMRRQRTRDKQLHPVGGSGAATPRPIEHLNHWRHSCQLTHWEILYRLDLNNFRAK